jgi:peptide/nickel transport system substrate-binding protein
MNQFINMQTRNCLVEIDENFEAIPELAASWEPSPDAIQWTFKLREGVEFHNGKTMTAEDVVYSINHHRKKDTKSAAKGIVAPIKDIKANGKHTVVFTLEGGNADFPYIMSDYHLSIAPAGTEDKDWDKGIGTGGYVLKKWEPGVRVFAVRNPNYWKEGRAHFDEVETLGIADPNARTSALKTGEIDFMDRCDLKTVHLLKKMPEVEVTATPSTTHYSVPMRTDKALYDNNDVRMALKLAVDRDALVKTILRGYGEPGNDHPIGSIQKYFAKELPQRVYDPEKAKWHIKKAGLEGHTFKLHAAEAAFGGAVDSSILYREHAAKAGINIEVVREPNDGYWSNVWMKKDWCMCYWGGRVTPDLMFSTAYAAGAGWNDTFWKHERFNKLLVDARAELDEAKRAEMYAEMQAIVSNEGGQVIPMFAQIVAANSKKLHHGKIAGNYEMDGQRLAERWWFEA